MLHNHLDNTNQDGDGIAVIATTMAHSPILITEELLHMLSPMMISKLNKMLKVHNNSVNTNQDGDGIQATATTMVHSLTSTTEELLHMLSPTTTD